jgi:hypothetical protein
MGNTVDNKSVDENNKPVWPHSQTIRFMYCDIPVDQFFITQRSGAAPRPLCATHGCLATTTNTDRNVKTMDIWIIKQTICTSVFLF